MTSRRRLVHGTGTGVDVLGRRSFPATVGGLPPFVPHGPCPTDVDPLAAFVGLVPGTNGVGLVPQPTITTT